MMDSFAYTFVAIIGLTIDVQIRPPRFAPTARLYSSRSIAATKSGVRLDFREGAHLD